MTKPFRPMLAEDATEENIAAVIRRDGFVYASYKLDGIRALTINGGLFSRSMKPIPNEYTRRVLSAPYLQDMDGELICGDPFGAGVFARSSSAFMSHGGEPKFTYWVFDRPYHAAPFAERYEELTADVTYKKDNPEGKQCIAWVQLVPQWRIDDVAQLQHYETDALDLGYEGLIIKSPRAPYKQGRSTLKEGWMLKLKRFADSEAMIVGFEELYHNANEARLDERGFARRSSHKAGQIPAGMLGALQVRDVHHGWEFNIGSGFDHNLRAGIWEARERFMGRFVKYKYLPIGMKDVPRHPIFLGFRDPVDM